MADIISEYEDKLPSKIIEDIRNNISKGISDNKLRKIMEATYEEYINARVQPGESVGLISAESIGEPGTQMCLSYDERILVKYDDSIKIVRIGEFADSILDSGIYPVGKASGYEYADVHDVQVLSLNNDEKLEWKKVSKINRIDGPSRLLKIKTKSGRSITATDYHSFVTRKNNKIVSIAGKDLKIGNRIPSIKYLPEHCAEAINVYEHVDYPKDDFRVKREYRPTKIIPEFIELDFDFGWFIGAYLAEGSAPLGQVGISNINESYIMNARRFISKINLDYSEKHHHRGFADSRDFIVNSSLLAKFMRNICGNGSANKRVPEFAYSAKEEFVAGLLRSYFDGDGNISVDRRMIRIASNSEELLDGIKLLLARFGIFAFKSRDYKQDYLIIPSKYASIFLEKISSDIDYKKNNLEKLSRIKNHQDYTDVISGFDDVLIDVSRKLGLPTRYVNSATKRQKIGRSALLRHISIFEREALRKKSDISNELDILKRMAYSDVIWDEIEQIVYVKSPNKFVYDLTVPDIHTFTTFDGMVTHNTLNTFHFAGVAEMNVTLGLPRIIEILDGRKELDNPMMEIYLKKPYATGKKIDELRHLALQIKETKLREISTEFTINIADFTIEVKLDKDKMKEIDTTNNKVMDAISKQLKGCNIKDSKDTLVLKSRSKEDTFNDAYKTKEKIKDITIKGIKGITQVLPVKREDEFVIITAGSNLADTLQLEEVDAYRTTTNNVFEIEQVLGIEAARQAIVNEIFKVIESQGLNVDVRHIMLVADTMCVSGTLKGITRYGVVSDKSSVLARASFETPIKHIINAALVGEVDNLDSVVENVMINQPVPIGTGLPSLAVKPPQKAKEK